MSYRFWFAPMIGAAVAAIIYGNYNYITAQSNIILSFAPTLSSHTLHVCVYVFVCYAEYAPLKPKKRDTKENMAEALFMSKKKRYGWCCSIVFLFDLILKYENMLVVRMCFWFIALCVVVYVLLVYSSVRCSL